ncbi:MAG TPA: hypothetical protein VMW11_03720 [Candidatus Dormibacteraeota bacterium]|nr:hypothetical protein [Candidatus Dormibacteraeota bacterium]
MGRRSRNVTRTYKHQVAVSFPDELYGALAEFASRTDLPLNFSIRALVGRGLEAEACRLSGQEDGSLLRQLKTLGYSALAGLIAIEQTQRLLIAMLPDGADRAEELWEEAASAARDRLVRIEEAFAEETA